MDTVAIVSALNELTQLVDSAVDKTALTRLKSDFAAYFREVPPGTKVPWCDGILTKLADGSATYKSTTTGPFGITLPFTATTDLAVLRKIPAIEKSWQTTYPGAFTGEAILALIDKLKTLIGDGAVTPPVVPPVIPPIILPPASSEKIKWLTTRAEAMAAAQAQNRKIFMLAGKNSCSVTEGMRDIACELQPTPEYPSNPPIKALIEANFVPWWADIDGAGHIEYEQYAPYGMFNMPLMCIIDANGTIVPKTNAAGLAVKYLNGNQKYQVLYDWLKQYV